MMPAASMEVTPSQSSPQSSPKPTWMDKPHNDVTTQNVDDVMDKSVESTTSSPSRPDSGMAIVLNEVPDSASSPKQNEESSAASFKPSNSPSQLSADSGIVSSSGPEESPTSTSSLMTSSTRRDVSLTDSRIQTQRNLNLIACEECGLICAGQSHYQVHIRSHTGKRRPFKCTVCGVAFTQKGNLRRHYKIHSEEKPFQCPVCSYRCRRRDALNGHMRIHSDVRPYRCVYCARSYKSRQSLKEHEYQCPYKNDPIVQAHQMTSSPAKGNFSTDKRLSPLTSQSSNSVISLTPSNLPLMMQSMNPLMTSSTATSSGKRKASIPQKYTRVTEQPQASSPGIPNLANALQYMPTLLTTMMQQHLNDSANAEQHQQDEAIDFSSKRGLNSGFQNSNGDLDGHPDNAIRHPKATNERPSGSARRKRPKYLNEKIEQRHTQESPFSATKSNYDDSPSTLDLSGAGKDMTSQNDVRTASPFANVRSGDAARSGLRVFATLVEDSEIEEVKGYVCGHCRCIFLDHVMFAIHVGCHGYNNPFECNVCGHLAADRYQFESHLTRAEHNGKADVREENYDVITETTNYEQSSALKSILR
uniref:C2H2-type domain-containing protein n=1 Tax=Ciona savignyi TaxID=51511 RepID=H2YH50_CIOSA